MTPKPGKRHGLDTSFVMRFVTGTPPDLAREALDFLETCRETGGTVEISSVVASEVYFALQHHLGISKANALECLRDFLSLEGVVAFGGWDGILTTPHLESARPGFVDRLIHAEYSIHDLPLVTFEKTANRLPGSLVLGIAPAGSP